MTCRSVSDLTSLEPDGRPRRRHLRGARVRRPAVGEARPLSRAVADHLRRPDPHPAADPARGERPALPHRPGRGALRSPPHAPAAGPLHAGAQRDPRAHPLGHALPASGEPRPGARLVRSLPGQGQAADAAAPGEPGREVRRGSRPWSRRSPCCAFAVRTARSGERSGPRRRPSSGTPSPSTPPCRPDGPARSSCASRVAIGTRRGRPRRGSWRRSTAPPRARASTPSRCSPPRSRRSGRSGRRRPARPSRSPVAAPTWRSARRSRPTGTCGWRTPTTWGRNPSRSWWPWSGGSPESRWSSRSASDPGSASAGTTRGCR